MAYLLTALAAIVLAGVQTGLGGVWRPLGVKPDLVLVAVIVFGVAFGPRRALVAAIAGGISLDVLGILPVGTQVIALSAAAPLTALRARSGENATVILPLLLMPSATVIANLVQLIALTLLGWPVPWGTWIGQIVVPLIVVNALTVPVLWWSVGWFRRTNPRFALRR